MAHETSIGDVTVIETPRLLLRRWQSADREPFARLNADPRVMEFLPAILSREQSDALADRLEAHFNCRGFTFFALELRGTGEFIGFTGAAVVPFEAHFTPCVEVGWRLAFEHWGHGFATEAAHAVLRYCRETLNLPQVVAFTVPANVRSRRVMEKCEMTYDPSGAFDHPNIPQGHPLRRHVLYRYTVAQALVPAGPGLIPAPAV